MPILDYAVVIYKGCDFDRKVATSSNKKKKHSYLNLHLIQNLVSRIKIDIVISVRMLFTETMMSIDAKTANGSSFSLLPSSPSIETLKS